MSERRRKIVIAFSSLVSPASRKRTAQIVIAALIAGSTTLMVRPARAEQKPRAMKPIFLNDEAHQRLTETIVEHSFTLAYTNEHCDSALSPDQCLATLSPTLQWFRVPLALATDGKSMSAPTLEAVDAALAKVVSASNEPARYNVLRDLGLEASVAFAIPAFHASRVTRTTPASILRLYTGAGIGRVEIAHRLLISGDRILVDHKLLDRGAANPQFAIAAVELSSFGVQDIVDTAEALRANLEKSMSSFALTASKIIDSRRKKSETKP